ncbi:MAG: DUF4383 domain-containing protein [Phycisphaerales bacterium]
MLCTSACKVIGVAFIAAGIWGFIDGERVLVFHVNTLHNIVHLASGLVALACGFGSFSAARWFCSIFGLVYGTVAVLGFMNVEPVVTRLHLNEADNWLHAGIAAALLVAAAVDCVRRNPHVLAHHDTAGPRPSLH